MIKYLIDDDGYFTKATKGQVSPHGALIFPARAIDKVPPNPASDQLVRWDKVALKWELIPDPAIAVAKQEADQLKLTEPGPDGVSLYYLNPAGQVVPKNAAEIDHSIMLLKRGLYMEQRSTLLGQVKNYLLLALAGSDATLASALISYRNALIAMGPSINARTDMDALVYPAFPDVTGLDPLDVQDLSL